MMIIMCKEKASALRLRVKAVVMQTRDDTPDVSRFTCVSNLTAPQPQGGDRVEHVKAFDTTEEELKMEEDL